MTSTQDLRDSAGRHLWRHFADMNVPEDRPLRIFTRGDGCYLIDSDGERFLDGVSNLFCVNVGYSHGADLGRAALEQYEQLGYHSSWGSTHPRAVELAEALADLAPAGLDHVFLTPSGGESIEAAWKMARQYHLLRGEDRWKVVARTMAFHGTTLGALSINGVPNLRHGFGPLLAPATHARNTSRSGRPEGESEEDFTTFLLADLEQRMLSEDPRTMAMLVLEPVQNHGGMLMPPRGYAEGVRALCDRYGILLVADETITAFGRCGAWFASERFGFRPDIITTAKGLSSAHAVIGAVIASRAVFETFKCAGQRFSHGNTFGGHPVMAAVALRNLELMAELGLPQHVMVKEQELRSALETLLSIPIVTDVRGCGFFYGVELTASDASGTQLAEHDFIRLYGTLADDLEDRGLLIRVTVDEGDPVLSIAPPLVADTAEFEFMIDVLATVLAQRAADPAFGRN